MREIKFRAWYKAYNGNRQHMECVDDFYWFEENAVRDVNDIRYKIMQFTGLHDKNGVEIYEGDVVRCTQKGQSRSGEVEWNSGMWSWKYEEGGICWLYEAIQKFKGEVIGNIYDNPELVKP